LPECARFRAESARFLAKSARFLSPFPCVRTAKARFRFRNGLFSKFRKAAFSLHPVCSMGKAGLGDQG
jgi:hypothetical protein